MLTLPTSKPNNNPCKYLDKELMWSRQMKSIDCGKEIVKQMDYIEAKDFLELKIACHLLARDKHNRIYRKLCRSVYGREDLTQDEADILIDLVWCGVGIREDLNNQERLDELAKYWQENELRRPGQTSSSINRQQTLERARLFPIEQLYQCSLRDSGSRLVGLCPFHEEKTPSFYIFTDSNTYHCFGCSAHGDSINFYMRVNQCDFNQALSILGNK